MLFNGSTNGQLRGNELNATGYPERCGYLLTANTWTHYVWVRKSAGITTTNTDVYINGIENAGATGNLSGTQGVRTDSLPFCIGKDADSSVAAPGNPYCWTGQLGEIQVSNVVRDTNWIRLSYKNQLSATGLTTFGTITTIGPAAPAAPTLATPANAATGIAVAPTLTWGTVTGAVTYRVQLSTISTFATTVADDSTLTVGTKAITGLANSTTYYWQVNAKNAGGTSAWSGIFSFTTVPVTSGVPTLTSPSDAATGIAIAPTLTWGTVAGAVTYRVQLSTVSTFATTVADDSTLTVGTKAITGLTNSTVYYWRVNSKNSGGTSAWATAFSFTTIIAAPATAPTLTAPANAATGISVTPTLTWGTVAGAATYRVQLSTISTFASTVVDDSTLTAGSKTISSALTLNVTYYWRVNAKNAGGTSAWSALSSFTTASTGVITATPHYLPATMGHNGVLEVYMANGSRVMEIAYGASATKTQLLNTASKTLARGYYTYRFRGTDAHVEIVGKLVK
jgi:hypothetical protein